MSAQIAQIEQPLPAFRSSGAVLLCAVAPEALQGSSTSYLSWRGRFGRFIRIAVTVTPETGPSEMPTATPATAAVKTRAWVNHRSRPSCSGRRSSNSWGVSSSGGRFILGSLPRSQCRAGGVEQPRCHEPGLLASQLSEQPGLDPVHRRPSTRGGGASTRGGCLPVHASWVAVGCRHG